MLTIFCSPKPFVNEAEWNQINALRSWRAIHPEAEIFVFGAEIGAAKASKEVGAVLVPEIECSSSGAPSFNAMAEYVCHFGKYDLQVYVNADILLTATILKAMTSSQHMFKDFLLVGERMDLVENQVIDVRESSWEMYLDVLVETGRLMPHGPTGVDYFGFFRGMWSDLLPVNMGRGRCDQALLHFCLKHRIPVVDGTLAVISVHQFHDYRHVSGGEQEVMRGADRDLIAREHGLNHSVPTIADSNWRITVSGKIVQDHYRRRFLRRMELTLRYHFGFNKIAMLLRLLQYFKGKHSVLPRQFPARLILQGWGNSSLLEEIE